MLRIESLFLYKTFKTLLLRLQYDVIDLIKRFNKNDLFFRKILSPKVRLAILE